MLKYHQINIIIFDKEAPPLPNFLALYLDVEWKTPFADVVLVRLHKLM